MKNDLTGSTSGLFEDSALTVRRDHDIPQNSS
jgi:hypothetical protein